MVKSLVVRVLGDVQGVFYRQSTKEMAIQLGLKGFVQNHPDGSVYIEVEGEVESIDKLITWCHKGPPRARVQKIMVHDSGEIKGFTSFVVNR